MRDHDVIVRSAIKHHVCLVLHTIAAARHSNKIVQYKEVCPRTKPGGHCRLQGQHTQIHTSSKWCVAVMGWQSSLCVGKLCANYLWCVRDILRVSCFFMQKPSFKLCCTESYLCSRDGRLPVVCGYALEKPACCHQNSMSCQQWW